MKNTKRFMALLLALVLVFSSMTTAFAAVNEDVVGTDYEVAVGKLNAIGVMEGYPDGTFRAEGQITRAEFAAIAVRALGLGDAANAAVNTIFTDVNAMHWAAGYINLAVDRGIIKGYPDGTYRPEGQITNAEAITILVRLVGLGPVIDKQGTWPVNYVSAANNEGILTGVAVASSANATRGNAAKMLINAIVDVDKWEADGYDSNGAIQYSRTNMTLLTENLEITEESGRLMTTSTDEVEIDSTTYDYVGADFDTEYLFLNEVDAWVNADEDVVYMTKTSTQLFDAVKEFDTTNYEKLKAVEADKEYDFFTGDNNVVEDVDVEVYVDGEEKNLTDLNATYDYAKLVLNDKNKVVAISVYDWDSYVVVDEVDDNDVLGLGDEILDAEDFTIVKDGMTITLEDLEEGDILYYNNDAEYAEVYNRSVVGEIEDVFSASFVVDGEEYDLPSGVYNEDLEDFTAAIAADMEDAEEEVTVYLDRNGAVVYVVGELGDGETNTVLGYLTANVVTDESFGRYYAEFEFVNEMNAEVTESPRTDDITVTDASGNVVTGSAIEADYLKDVVVEFTYEDDGDIDSVRVLDPTNASPYSPAEEAETDDTYFKGARLTSNTVVFLVDGDDVEAVMWSELDTNINVTDFYEEDGDALYLVAEADPEKDTIVGVVDDTRMNRDKTPKVVRITVWTQDGEKTYDVDEQAAVTNGAIVELEFEKDTNLVKTITTVTDPAKLASGTVVQNSVGRNSLEIGGTTYKLVSGALIIDASNPSDIKSIKITDIDDEGSTLDSITVVRDADSSEYVKIVIVE